VVGFAGGTIEKVPMNLVLLKNISLVGVHWGAYSSKSFILIHKTRYGDLTVFLAVKEESHIPVVWKNVIGLALFYHFSTLSFSYHYAA